jgi:hypothetical protein
MAEEPQGQKSPIEQPAMTPQRHEQQSLQDESIITMASEKSPPSEHGSEEGEMQDTDEPLPVGAPPLPDEPLPVGAPPLPDEPLPVGAPPLPDEPLPDQAPPLPDEPLPALTEQDDGWSAQLDAASGCWYFLNSFTGLSQWENPRVPTAVPSQQYAPGTGPTSYAPGTCQVASTPAAPPGEAYLGYNPKIHGDFDPNADYAKWHQGQQTQEQAIQQAALTHPTTAFEQAGTFNRFTGAFQASEKNADNHNDKNKSKRQMNAFFDVDAAANAHQGRSLKAERANQRLSKKQVKAFNQERRARKEQKRRDFLMS